MANPQSNLDELMKDPKAAGLLKNKALLQSLMQSPDTQRLMELLSQNAGDGLKTAAANAENNHNMDKNNLYVAECFVTPGPTLKRVMPRAQGRAFRILKRTSHITVVLKEKE